MNKDQELAALIEQAARNLETLELLTGMAFKKTVAQLQLRLRRLRDAYRQETDSLTQQILQRAIERRRGVDRRKSTPDSPAPPAEAEQT